MGQDLLAVDLIGQAIKASPKYAESHYNLGTIQNSLGNLRMAAQSLRQAAIISQP